MANSWKKLTDKIDKAPVDGPQAADWEAMSAKIAAQPALITPAGVSRWWWISGALVIVILGVGLGYWWYPPAQPSAPLYEEVITNSPNKTAEERKSNAIMQEEPVQQKSNKEQQENVAQKSTPATLEQNIVDLRGEIGNAPSEKVVSTGKPGNSSKEEAVAQIPVQGEVIVNHTPEEDESNAVSFSDPLNAPTEDALKESQFETESTEELIPEENEVLIGVDTQEEESSLVQVDKEFLADNTEESKVNLETNEELEEQKQPSQLDIENITDGPDNALAADEPEEEVPPINLRSEGFRLNSLSLSGAYMTDFSSDYYGSGIGVDVDLQKGAWLINTGIGYYTLHSSMFDKATYEKQNFNEITITNWDTTLTVSRDSVWIIDSAFAGHWHVNHDSTYAVDSTITSRTDTSVTKITTSEETRVKLSYVEIPLLLGKRFKINRVAIDIYGGVALNQTVSSNLEGGDISEKFGLMAIFRPGVRYYLSERWSLNGRCGLRYTLVADPFRNKKLYTNFQLGLTYHW